MNGSKVTQAFHTLLPLLLQLLGSQVSWISIGEGFLPQIQVVPQSVMHQSQAPG